MLNTKLRVSKTAILKGVAAAALIAMLPLSASHAGDKDMDRTITVSATGTAEAEPDQARITSGVATEAVTAMAKVA